MSRRAPLLVCRFLLLAFLAGTTWAQQTAQPSPVEESRGQLEAWRQSMSAQWMNDFADLGRYREANARLAAPSSEEKRVVFMGDSITDA